MSNALITLSQIEADAREFAEAARTDGFDASEALDRIEEIASYAKKRIDGIPAGSNVLVAAILMQDTICDDVIDLAENNLDMVLRERDGAVAVRTKLQGFVDLYGSPDSETAAHAASSAEGEAYDRCLDLIDKIDAVVR
jgi:predicted RNA-binding Zn ribbon-like protein